MAEQSLQQVSLVGQVLEDLSYAGLDPGRFDAKLVGIERPPQYKPGGFFVFSDVRPGAYTLQITGPRFQTQSCPVTLPASSLFFDQPGDNDLIIIVKSVKADVKKITFDAVELPAPIRSGAGVLAGGVSAHLAADLDAGQVTEAKLDDITGIAAGATVRIVRGKGVRLRFDPYYAFPRALARAVGKVTLQTAPQAPIAGAKICLTHINGEPVSLNDVAGATIATVTLPAGGVVLGTNRDVTTFTDANGYYNLYFSRGDLLNEITLQLTLSGYQSQTKTELIQNGQRKEISFQLTRT